jgi:hypothetical protein
LDRFSLKSRLLNMHMRQEKPPGLLRAQGVEYENDGGQRKASLFSCPGPNALRQAHLFSRR